MARYPLSTLDLALLAAYVLAVGLIGWRVGRSDGGRERAGADDFLLAGRQLTLPLFVGSLVSTWYGGLLGVTEIAFTNGLAAWLTQGGFWYVAYVIFALALAGRLAESGHVTLPDQLGALHGDGARLLATLLNFLNVVPIAYALSLGVLVHLALGWPLWLGTMLATALAALYSLVGGFRAVVYTDLLQFGLMCLAVALVLAFAVLGLGGGDYLEARLPATHLRASGSMGGQEIAVWALIALSTLVDPNFYQRCYAAGSARVARRGVLLAVGFWVLFDVCSTFGGLYARAALGPGADARLAYPLLAGQLLPAGLRGLFFVGLLATAMSTIDSYCFIGAMTLGHDILRRTLRPELDDATLVRSTRWGVALTAGLAAALAMLFSGSFKAIWKTLGSLSTAGMLVPAALGLLSGWRPPGAGLAGMIAGAVGTLGWSAARGLGQPLALRVEALLPGIALSVAAYLLVGLTRRRPPETSP